MLLHVNLEEVSNGQACVIKQNLVITDFVQGKEQEKLGANVVKRVAAGAHLPTPWLFEAAKRPDDRAVYCLNCTFLPQWKQQVLVFTLTCD